MATSIWPWALASASTSTCGRADRHRRGVRQPRGDVVLSPAVLTVGGPRPHTRRHPVARRWTAQPRIRPASCAYCPSPGHRATSWSSGGEYFGTEQAAAREADRATSSRKDRGDTHRTLPVPPRDAAPPAASPMLPSDPMGWTPPLRPATPHAPAV